MPAAAALAPSRTIVCASTIAVVVPSPAWSLVFEATSRTICAPRFSNLSSSSISLATVTPSLLTRGAPKDLSSTTLRPFGPNVNLTALARISTPRSRRSRASRENLTSLAAIGVRGERPLPPASRLSFNGRLRAGRLPQQGGSVRCDGYPIAASAFLQACHQVGIVSSRLLNVQPYLVGKATRLCMTGAL